MSDQDAIATLQAELELLKADRERERAALVARNLPPERVVPQHIRDAERRRAQEAEARHAALREADARREAHLAAVATERGELLAELSALGEREDAERARHATELASISRDRLRVSRKLAAVEAVPDAPSTTKLAEKSRQRLQALIGGHS